ncbi:exostosin-1 [Cloeon dipterum]|uniref:exostosin-1 n=1 Tax=Cloeon dipterum TaxID=197152 RepID=UPI00321F7DAC
MQAKKRYLLVLLSCAFLAYCYFGGYRLKSGAEPPPQAPDAPAQPSFLAEDVALNADRDLAFSPSVRRQSHGRVQENPLRQCRMETCFDVSRCRGGELKVYVYPTDAAPEPSPTYRKILNVILESRYYTPDPQQACLFVLALDTLDRDSLSGDYVRSMQSRVQHLEHWNDGRNHLIFNLYAGTWPEYDMNDLGFDIGYAMLARASAPVSILRPGFDISIPLFHRNHLEKGGEPGLVNAVNFPGTKKYLLAFKGKRYVHGIGSETRNSLYHLHNSRDVILVTTCKHGRSWRDLQDERCDEDNAEYDRYDYEVLLQNSTFCLVPRGRRLGSFRFLEALQAGCIPVLLANGWVLPFDSVIDWSLAAVWADERLLLQVPDSIRSIEVAKLISLRQWTQILWERYFSSIEKIVHTTLEIVFDRVSQEIAGSRSGLIWNSAPGALFSLPQFSDTWSQYPFYTEALGSEVGPNFTAVIYSHPATTNISPNANTPLIRLLKSLGKSLHLSRVIVLWSVERPPPPRSHWPILPVPLTILHNTAGISARFRPQPLIETAAVLSLDDDSLLSTDEIDFAYNVWRSFPDRIVGYPARSHFWDDAKATWGYTSKWTNDYSLVLTGAAFYHHYYHHLYTYGLGPLLHKTVEQSQNCEDILMNFLVSHVTRRPPIKVTQRKVYKENPASGSRSPWNDPDHFVQRQTCLNTFAAVFGYMPLLRSNMRLDPVLFKDSVSNMRKKYRQIELVMS